MRLPRDPVLVVERQLDAAVDLAKRAGVDRGVEGDGVAILDLGLLDVVGDDADRGRGCLSVHVQPGEGLDRILLLRRGGELCVHRGEVLALPGVAKPRPTRSRRPRRPRSRRSRTSPWTRATTGALRVSRRCRRSPSWPLAARTGLGGAVALLATRTRGRRGGFHRQKGSRSRLRRRKRPVHLQSARIRAMSAIDIGIIVFALALATIGWDRGLIASAMPLAGFIGGVALGARLGPALLEEGAESPYAPAVAAACGILLGVFLAIALEGVGAGVRERLAHGSAGRVVDSVGGAVLLATLALAAAWVFGAVALTCAGKGGSRPPRGRAALVDPGRPERRLPALGAAAEHAAADRPSPDVRGPRGERGTAGPRHRRRSGSRSGGRVGRAGPGQRLRAGRRGLGLGRCTAARRDERARRRRARTTPP